MSQRKLVDLHHDAVARHLRELHPTKTAECVAAAIGFPVETVRPWLRGTARPNGAAMLALIGAYGLELLAVALPNAPAWLARALTAERRRAAMDEMRRLGERLEALRDDEGTAPPVLGRPVAGVHLGREADDARG